MEGEAMTPAERARCIVSLIERDGIRVAQSLIEGAIEKAGREARPGVMTTRRMVDLLWEIRAQASHNAAAANDMGEVVCADEWGKVFRLVNEALNRASALERIRREE
jgi:hypothetical protein